MHTYTERQREQYIKPYEPKSQSSLQCTSAFRCRQWQVPVLESGLVGAVTPLSCKQILLVLHFQKVPMPLSKFSPIQPMCSGATKVK